MPSAKKRKTLKSPEIICLLKKVFPHFPYLVITKVKLDGGRML